ncbi:MAG: hypothetical protein R2794_13590 [Chitinophagales bacterium]
MKQYINRLLQLITAISIFLLSLFAAHTASAQNIYISESQKISTELIGYNILGKNKNGDVLIYKKYRFEDEIDVFDKQMNFKRRKDITMRNLDYETVEIFKSGESLYHFYTYKENKNVYLSVQRLNAELERKGEPIVIDSSSLRLGTNFSEFKVRSAENNPYFLIYKYELSNGRIDKLFSITMDNDMHILQNNEINLPDNMFDPILVKEDITDDGMPVFLFSNDAFNCKRDKPLPQYAFIFPRTGNTYVQTDVIDEQFCLDEMNFGLDKTNNNIVAVGFLKEDNKDYMVGYAFLTIHIGSGAIATQYNYMFTQETLDEIAGLAKEKSIRNLPVYQIGNVIARADGGALLIAEYYDKTVENYEYTNFDPYTGYRTSNRQVEFYEYDDILLYSIQPDGQPSWNNVIRKKQISREDRGVNSSYSVVNCKDRLYFIFNEDVEQNSNVLQYEMLPDGTLDRKSIFNANQQEVQIRPSSADQISFNEVIIPSIYRKTLAFVKLVY